ncbi:MAG TPA: NepR family anti-sigma factor [Hyphomicrobiaceae bacterium]|nr:NepR family anti-sigma factor [Hyphomicrobiaceae bacterium]
MAHIVDRQQQAHLGEILRAIYQQVVDETLPEPIGNLLDALERPASEVKATSGSLALHSERSDAR